MTDSALVLHESTALSAYAEREDVRELGDRLMAMHPSATEVGSAGMRAAAQLSLLLGANPLPGVNEVHIWRDNKGRTCMSLGINYWRRKSQEWGGVLYQTEPRPMTAQEATLYNIPQGVMGAICKGARATDVIKYRQLGFSTIEIWSMCGRIGIGTQQPTEYAKQGRPSIWTAMKRAETDMLRQLFPAEFGSVDRQAFSAGAAPIAIEGVTETADTEDGQERKPYTVDDLNHDLYDEPIDAVIGAPEEDGFEAAELPAQPQPARNDNGKPADPQPAAGPMPEDEALINDIEPRDFIPAVASLIGHDEDTVRAWFKEQGMTSVPKGGAARVRAYRAIRDEIGILGEAEQAELVAIDGDAPNGAYSD